METRSWKKCRLEDGADEAWMELVCGVSAQNAGAMSAASSTSTPSTDTREDADLPSTSSSHFATADEIETSVMTAGSTKLAAVSCQSLMQPRTVMDKTECMTSNSELPVSNLTLLDNGPSVKTSAEAKHNSQLDALRSLWGVQGIGGDHCQECSTSPCGSAMISAIYPGSSNSCGLTPESLQISPTASCSSPDSLGNLGTISPSSLIELPTDECIFQTSDSSYNNCKTENTLNSSASQQLHNPVREQESRTLKSPYSLRDLGPLPRYREQRENHHAINSAHFLFEKSIEKALYDDNQQDLASINQLPMEILCMILSYIPESDIAKRCAPVCRHWYIATKNPVLWRTLTFSGNSVPFDEVTRILKQASLLKSFTISDRPDVDLILPALHENCQRLEYVEIKNCSSISSKNDIVPVKYLHPLTRHGKYLRCLSIDDTNFHGRKFFKDLGKLPKLQRLNVNCSRAVTPSVIEEIATYPELRSLKVKWSSHTEYLTPSSLIYLRKTTQWVKAYAMLFQNVGSRLTSLELYVGHLKDEELEGLKYCTNLKQLVLHNAAEMGSRGMAAIGSLSSLEHLEIHRGYGQMTPQVVTTTFTTGNLKTLQVLCFINCYLRSSASHSADDCMEAVAKSCPDLRHVSVAKCTFVTDEGVRAVLRNCPNLQTLDLYGTASVTGSCFLDIPAHTPHLQELVIEEQCYGSKSENLSILIKMFPSVEIKSQSSPL